MKRSNYDGTRLCALNGWSGQRVDLIFSPSSIGLNLVRLLRREVLKHEVL
jgi:hypothetical protein